MKLTWLNKRGSRGVVWAVAGVVLVVAAGWGHMARRARIRAAEAEIGLTAEVRRGPLTISLVEAGTIQNRERVIVRSEVEGNRTIIQLVDEGTIAQKGDLLVELDSSSLEEQRLEQEARLENSEASVVQSRESLEVARNQAAADVSRAELDLRFARLALEQYVEGEFPQEIQQAEAAITIAREELQRARDKLEWSRTLEAEGYITRSELDADELALRRRQIDLDLAESRLALLRQYTNVQRMEKLQSDIEQAEMALERVQRRARADVIRAESDLRSRDADLRHQSNRLDRLRDQIEKCRILAPSGGMVVYATSVQTHRWRRIDPLEPGQTVRERQELVHLPTTGDMMVEISVQEASLPKIRVGLPARITLDSGPDRAYSGVLRRIGVLPDSNSMAMNPDLKLYACSVFINDADADLRQGMSCTVEVLIEEHAAALYVPLQSLVRLDGQPTVYVVRSRRVEPQPVRIGLDNGRMVHILEGVEEGDRVLLAPPLETSVRRERDGAAEELGEAGLAPPSAGPEPPRTSEEPEDRRGGDEGERRRPSGERPAGERRPGGPRASRPDGGGAAP